MNPDIKYSPDDIQTRNYQKNYSTEQNPVRNQPLNSKFDARRQASIGKTHENELLDNRNGEISILFSAVRNKTTNQLTSTYDGPLLQNMSKPEPPQLAIRRWEKDKLQNDPFVVTKDNDMSLSFSSNPYASKEAIKPATTKPQIGRNRFRATMRHTHGFKDNKIRTTNAFQLRMENRKTHGNLVNSNIRPQSAGMLGKLNKRDNIIDRRLRQRGFKIDLQRNIIEKGKPIKKNSYKIDYNPVKRISRPYSKYTEKREQLLPQKSRKHR